MSTQMLMVFLEALQAQTHAEKCESIVPTGTQMHRYEHRHSFGVTSQESQTDSPTAIEVSAVPSGADLEGQLALH